MMWPVESNPKSHSRSSSVKPSLAHASRCIHFGIESNTLRISQNVMKRGSPECAPSSRLSTCRIAVCVPCCGRNPILNYVWVAQIWVWVPKTHFGPFKPLGQTNLGVGPKFGFGFGPKCQLRLKNVAIDRVSIASRRCYLV